MASGHVNRINRPNTWLHRPMLRREVLTCQLGAVHTWHLADVLSPPPLVGEHTLAFSVRYRFAA